MPTSAAVHETYDHLQCIYIFTNNNKFKGFRV